jgi:hypothetical protein
MDRLRVDFEYSRLGVLKKELFYPDLDVILIPEATELVDLN